MIFKGSADIAVTEARESDMRRAVCCPGVIHFVENILSCVLNREYEIKEQQMMFDFRATGCALVCPFTACILANLECSSRVGKRQKAQAKWVLVAHANTQPPI